jgi:hypothetical protein
MLDTMKFYLFFIAWREMFRPAEYRHPAIAAQCNPPARLPDGQAQAFSGIDK